MLQKFLENFSGILEKSGMKFIGNLKWILDKTLGIFGNNFENFWGNLGLIINKF